MSILRPIRVIKQFNNVNSASVIFLHGSGDAAKSFLEWIQLLVKNFGLPHVKFIIPTAPRRPYTPMNGQMSNVWFDRAEISPNVPEDDESMEDIRKQITALISQEVESGIPLNKIIIGGFSMGGSLALHAAYRFVPGLAGVFAMSSFLNHDSAVYKNIQSANTPLLMFHGDEDQLVPLNWGEKTFQKLTSLGVKGEFITLDGTSHELEKNELEKLLQWITKIIPPNGTQGPV